MIEKGKLVSTLTISTKALYAWAFATAMLAATSAVLYQENQKIKAVPIFIYAGPKVPHDIMEKINMSIENLDEQQVESWYKDRVYDKDFQMAMFYSYLSNALAEKAAITKNEYADGIRRDVVFEKSISLWQEVIKKDSDLVVFRDYFVNKYKETKKHN